MSQHLTRQGDALAGAVSKVALSTIDFKGLVATAVRDGGGHLKVLVWKISDAAGNAGAETIVRQADATAGEISDVVTVSPAAGVLVTVARDGGGDLKLTAWHVSSNGTQIQAKSHASGGAVGAVAAAAYNGNVVTAVKDGSGNLKLIAWSVGPGGASITRRGDATAGAVGKVAVVAVKTGVVTAVRDGGGNLKVIAWQVSTDGTQIQRKGDASAGAVSDVVGVAVTELSDPGFTNPRAEIATAVRDGSGGLKLITWTVSLDSAQKVTRLADATGENSVGRVAITRVGTPFTTDRVVTAVRDGSGKLDLRAWNTDATTQLQLESSASAGSISEVAVDSVWSNYLVTAVRDGSGNLKLIGWKHE